MRNRQTRRESKMAKKSASAPQKKTPDIVMVADVIMIRIVMMLTAVIVTLTGVFAFIANQPSFGAALVVLGFAIVFISQRKLKIKI